MFDFTTITQLHERWIQSIMWKHANVNTPLKLLHLKRTFLYSINHLMTLCGNVTWTTSMDVWLLMIQLAFPEMCEYLINLYPRRYLQNVIMSVLAFPFTFYSGNQSSTPSTPTNLVIKHFQANTQSFLLGDITAENIS